MLDHLVRTEAVAAPGPTTNVTVFRGRLGQDATAAGQDPVNAEVVKRGAILRSALRCDRLSESPLANDGFATHWAVSISNCGREDCSSGIPLTRSLMRSRQT